MEFDVHLLRQDRCAVVRVRGEIDVLSRERFEEAMMEALEAGGPMVVDMREVTFCDSTGLNAIVTANRRALARGTAMALVALPPRIRRVFRITAVDEFIPIYDTLREAVSALPSTTSS
ncbi:STAS domain-containing protein [Actinomadura viridis]|uniref:Anti-sigma factor antagonist n=1 Tax=Actinomadura viridis TaxID=58110 RepID=A0A931GLF4_9ACTN|nr:STAS domain-containing protein [Actinomadura viridis]MBG6091998.1 anti-sigma B factor antagonist [Actinomadura viridis]